MIAQRSNDLEYQDLGQHDAGTEHGERSHSLRYRNRQQTEVYHHRYTQCHEVQSSKHSCTL